MVGMRGDALLLLWITSLSQKQLYSRVSAVCLPREQPCSWLVEIRMCGKWNHSTTRDHRSCQGNQGITDTGRIHCLRTMSGTKFCTYPFCRCFDISQHNWKHWPAGCTGRKVRGSLKLLGFIPSVPWISVPSFMLIHPVGIRRFTQTSLKVYSHSSISLILCLHNSAWS